MKPLQLSIPAAALALAFSVSTPLESSGYTTLGSTLGLGQRDFRIFNNFTASGANNNQTADPNFPGYFGADMAIWKGCIEWASELHGNGDGDPHQPFGLGSGGANFDPSFQGNANGIGGTDDNIHSQIGGSSGGTLAYMEGPAGNGWRIRYYQNWSWQDGPGLISSGFDLQSVACHEYGHALGLGHSASGGATMAPSTGNGQEHGRSIHADDIAGVQFVYGVKDPGKARITGISINGQVVTISGLNFDATNNKVWFTQRDSGGDGIPIKVLNVPSTGGAGTQVVVNVPAAAGPGDIFVRQGNPAWSSLSNPWPIFPNDPPVCDSPANYCIAAPHSQSGGGPGAVLSMSGSQIVADNNFTLEVDDAPSDKFGLFFYGPNQIQASFGDGFRCVGGSTKRLPLVQTDNLGHAAYSVDLPGQPLLSAGSTHNFQYWYRDPMGPGGTGFNTSDGLSVPFCE